MIRALGILKERRVDFLKECLKTRVKLAFIASKKLMQYHFPIPTNTLLSMYFVIGVVKTAKIRPCYP